MDDEPSTPPTVTIIGGRDVSPALGARAVRGGVLLVLPLVGAGETKESRREEQQLIYRIEPYVEVGPIRLGMTREEVQRMLGAPREPAMHRGSAPPGDIFPTLGIFVDYRAPGVCEFVEFARDSPCSPTLHGQAFLGQPYRRARAWFEAYDAGLETHGAGLIARQFGVALYASAADKAPDEPVEAVAVFEQGYYNHQAAL